MMKIGFSGTRQGMTERQKEKFKAFVKRFAFTEFHHGDCVGADKEAHEMLLTAERLTGTLRIPTKIIVHPPINSSLRAYADTLPPSTYLRIEVKGPQPYQERNQEIINECDILIIAPQTPKWTPYSGTWSTYTKAKKDGKPVLILWP